MRPPATTNNKTPNKQQATNPKIDEKTAKEITIITNETGGTRPGDFFGLGGFFGPFTFT